MVHIINNESEEMMISNMLDGVAATYNTLLQRIPKTYIMLKKTFSTHQVGLVSGGGSGHEPAHFGFVGEGMLTASVHGVLFEPPQVSDIVQAIKLSDQGLGVLLIVKNFAADVARFSKAQQIASQEGHHVSMVIVHDDCSLESNTFTKRRRGVAGTVFVHKVLGAAAKSGLSLAELTDLGERVISEIYTLGVAVRSGYLWHEEEPMFPLRKDEVSFGIGIHGEPGYRYEPYISSEYLANELVNKLEYQFDDVTESPFAILINGLGSTTPMEQFLMTHDILKLLSLKGIDVQYCNVGSFMTSTNMSGISLTLFQLKDKQWLKYLNESTTAFAW